MPGVESLCLDVCDEANCRRACEGAVEVYNLAADMGGMGFIERFRIECLRSILINTHMIEAAYRAGARRYFFSSSACAYNTPAERPQRAGAQGIRRLPGHGRARLRLGEADLRNVLPGILGRARPEDLHRPLPQRLRPLGTWDGGREKAPAAICRKVIEALDTGKRRSTSGATARQTRSFMYIDDCVHGIDQIMHCDELIATPINLGSSELVSINDLVTKVERIAGVKLKRKYDLDAPRGRGRPQQRQHLHPADAEWEPSPRWTTGMESTYAWIKQQIRRPQGGQARRWNIWREFQPCRPESTADPG